MSNIRLSRSLCTVVGESLVGSHPTLDALFISSGAPGDPPDLAHHSKWKEWLFRVGQDPNVDSLAVLGNILEEFMDVEPVDPEQGIVWGKDRLRVTQELEKSGFEYYQGGRVLPNGEEPLENTHKQETTKYRKTGPNSIDELLDVIVRGLPRAMHPLSNRRKNAVNLSFQTEYDIQDLLHAMLRPWVADIRAEEFTPSYAGSNTRMDFLLPGHSLVIETKRVRDRNHAGKVGDELVIDIAHYGAHPNCEFLWCVIYDPDKLLANAGGLISDLEGETKNSNGSVLVKVIVV